VAKELFFSAFYVVMFCVLMLLWASPFVGIDG